MSGWKWKSSKPRKCDGYDNEAGAHVSCTKVFKGARMEKRCDDCKAAHKRHYNLRYYHEKKRGRVYNRLPHPRVNRRVPSTEGRTPVPVCFLCANLPERRPAEGCPRCGMPPGPAAPLQQGSLLQSSAGTAVGR